MKVNTQQQALYWHVCRDQEPKKIFTHNLKETIAEHRKIMMHSKTVETTTQLIYNEWQRSCIASSFRRFVSLILNIATRHCRFCT
jgi:hypothetical protein